MVQQDPVQRYNEIQHRIQFQSRLDYLRSKNIKLDEKAILDFGAGHCLLYDTLVNGKVKNIDYSAVETDKKLIKKLKGRGLRIREKIDDFISKKFDIITLFHILEHLKNPKDIIKTIFPYLKDGGHIFIEIPNEDNTWKKNFEPHLLFFNVNSVKKMLDLTGFKLISLDSCGRSLKRLQINKTKFKILKNKTSRALKKYGLIKTSNKSDSHLSEKYLTKSLEVNCYGPDRQWLRILAKKIQ